MVETLAKQQLEIWDLKEKVKALTLSESSAPGNSKAAANDQEYEIESLRDQVIVLQDKVTVLHYTSANLKKQNSKLAKMMEQLQISGASKVLGSEGSVDTNTTAAVEKQDHVIEVLQEKVKALESISADLQEHHAALLSDMGSSWAYNMENDAMNGGHMGEQVATNTGSIKTLSAMLHEMEARLGDVEADCVTLANVFRDDEGLTWEDPRLQQLVTDVVDVTSQAEGITQLVMLPDSWIHMRRWDDPRLLDMEHKVNCLFLNRDANRPSRGPDRT